MLERSVKERRNIYDDVISEPENAINVLQIWGYYLPLPSGAAIRHNHMSPLLKEHNIHIEVLTLLRDEVATVETINDVKVFRLSVRSTENKALQNVYWSVSLCRELWKRRNTYDVLHSFSFNLFLVPVFFFAKLMGASVVLEHTLMDSKRKSALSGLLSDVAYRFYRQLDAFVAISSPLIREITGRGLPKSKCYLIPCGVYADRFTPVTSEQRMELRKEFGLDSDSVYLIFVGNFNQRKGVDILVEMMDILRLRCINVKMVFVGRHDFPKEDPARSFSENLKLRIQELGLDNLLIFTGLLDYEDVCRWLQACDIFVFPSRREGFGRALLEAMSVGLPCVSSELDGIVYDMIQSGENGIVTKENKPDNFAKQVIRLVTNGDLRNRMGEKARETVIDRFDQKKLAIQYKNLFQRILTCR